MTRSCSMSNYHKLSSLFSSIFHNDVAIVVSYLRVRVTDPGDEVESCGMDGGNEAGHAAQFHKAFVMNEIHGSADTYTIH